MFRYLLTVVLLLPVVACSGGSSNDSQETGGVAVSLHWPPSITGAVQSSAFGLPSGVTSIDMTVDFFGSDFDPDLHSMRVERLLDGTEQTTVDGSVLEPLGPQVRFDVLDGLDRGIFIAGVALLEGGGSVAFAGFSTFDVTPSGATVNVDLQDGNGQPQPPAIGVQGADSPVVATSLLITGEVRFPNGTPFQNTITSVVSSDPSVAEVDPLSFTTINLLNVGSATLTIEFAFGGPLDFDLNVASEAIVVSMSGTWSVTETLVSGGCPGDPASATYDVSIAQNGSEIAVLLPGADAALIGTIDGTDFGWDQSYPEDLGTTTELLSGTVSADGLSFTGSSSWSWTDGNPSNDCNGISSFEGTLLQ